MASLIADMVDLKNRKIGKVCIDVGEIASVAELTIESYDHMGWRCDPYGTKVLLKSGVSHDISMPYGVVETIWLHPVTGAENETH